MYIALDREKKRISIKEAGYGDKYYCPFCLGNVFVKSGSERATHFSHYPKSRCSDGWNGQYDMSKWHFDWQNKFPVENQEIVVQCDSIRHRADVLTDRTVVEFQHSPLSSRKFNDRNVFYHDNIGYKVVWLYDMRKDYENDYISETKSTYYSWDKPRLTFRRYSLRHSSIDLFFQIGEEGKCIIQVDKFDKDGFSVKKNLTKDEFLEYVGLHNGVCLQPLNLDITANKEYRGFVEKHSIELSTEQQRAMQAVNGANLILSVPGSGKTTVLVARMGYMIYNKRIPPENILAITYTRNATEDIRKRFADKFDAAVAARLNIYTINALCKKIIDRYVEMFRRKEAFKLLNENEQRKIIIELFKKIKNDPFPHDADIIEMQSMISYIKNMMLNTKEERAKYLIDSEYEAFYNQYQQVFRAKKLMDFDDQLVYAKLFLEKKPELLSEFSNRYTYICVDEAQDTSKIQHEIIKLLVSKNNNIFMVGDEDQSIYGFRAAYPRALLEFSDTYINPYILMLQTNYRSTEQIVSAAQSFISKNSDHNSEKIMRAERGEGKPIQIIPVSNIQKQYSTICSIAGKEHGQTAVLYRNNDSSIPLMDIFLRKGVAFRRLNAKGENFFTSRVAQDIEYFLRFALNQNDSEAFMNIYYKCGYGIKKNTAYWSCRKAAEKHITISDELINQLSKWNSLRVKAEDFKQRLKTISESKPERAVRLIEQYWYLRYARDKGLDIGKLSILKSLAVHEDTIPNFLKRLELLPKLIKEYECQEHDPIIISTIHAAKGLEFDNVYIIDVYDGCLPHRIIETAEGKVVCDNYEEERRLFYVAMTRAKNELSLLRINGENSSFINEVDAYINPSKNELFSNGDFF